MQIYALECRFSEHLPYIRFLTHAANASFYLCVNAMEHLTHNQVVLRSFFLVRKLFFKVTIKLQKIIAIAMILNGKASWEKVRRRSLSRNKHFRFSKDSFRMDSNY